MNNASNVYLHIIFLFFVSCIHVYIMDIPVVRCLWWVVRACSLTVGKQYVRS
jgi:uncharacterized MAPEG superfamily protein